VVISDRQTGKTAVAIDTILNKKNCDVVCVYVLGQARMPSLCPLKPGNCSPCLLQPLPYLPMSVLPGCATVIIYEKAEIKIRTSSVQR
jgi:hypothetical protein